MPKNKDKLYQDVLYVHDTLLKLRHIAQADNYPMLAYFIEMAWIEASDILRTEFGQMPRN